MRSNDTRMPSGRGMQAPDRPVPEPRAVTGTPCSVAARRIAATSSVVAGPQHRGGAHRLRGERLVVARSRR